MSYSRIVKQIENKLNQAKMLINEHVVGEPKESKSNKHLYLSLLKSFIRIGSFILLIGQQPTLCGLGLILAEIIGIFEEL